MTKKTNSKKMNADMLRREMQDRFDYMSYNEQYNGKHAKEFQFLESIVIDDEEDEDSSEEDRQARNRTARCLLNSLQDGKTDTDFACGCDDSRIAGRTVPIVAPEQLTGGARSNFLPSPSSTPNDVTPIIPRPGGYDGGLTIGWEGTWDTPCFERLKSLLGAAKEQAQNVRSGEHIKIFLCDEEVIVDPKGGTVGKRNTWHYKFHAFGVTFLIHQNLNNTQQVRATYGAEALAQNTLPALHGHVRSFLSSLGLTVTKETLTRVDMQVLIDVGLVEFLCLILKRHAIKKATKSAIYFRYDIPETYRAGSIDKVQVCLYDKRVEMRRMAADKMAVIIRHCIGDDWWNSKRPITRIEFRLGREALKGFRVTSVDDLLKREQGLIDVLTSDWFRLLEKKKVTGRGKRAKMHPLWKRVRSLFFEHFTGDEIRDVEYRKPAPVSGDPTALLKQAAGCASKAIAIQTGKQASIDDVVKYMEGFTEAAKVSIHRKANFHAESLGIVKGISIGGYDKDVEAKVMERLFEEVHHPTLRWRR